MIKTYHEFISMLFSLTIIAMAGFVLQEFLPAFVWAGVIAIAVWPWYRRLHHRLDGRDFLSAGLFVAAISLLIAAPLFWLTHIITREAHTLVAFFQYANLHGIAYPQWLAKLPMVGGGLHEAWDNVLGKPKSLQNITAYTQHIPAVTGYLRTFTLEVAHRGVILGFTLMILFFLLKDSYFILRQIAGLGHFCIGDRWALYSHNVPAAIKATLNGLVLVGIGVGIVMGGCYVIVGLPAPVTFACVTAVTAMIPLVVPFAFVLVALVLLVQGKLLASIFIIVFGTIIMFIADHFVRPVIIGGATRLPFLGVLFGILGGVKAFGVVGLFIGPIIMVLFVTLWHEADIFQETEREFIRSETLDSSKR
jgi:predicted PurR-regulated permease PerM